MHPKHAMPKLVAAFVHACEKLSAEPDADSEVNLLAPDVLHAIAEADELYSLAMALPAH